jgi:predicted nucleic acid-binding protein
VNGSLLDTNIPSEALRSRPDANVAAWLRDQTKNSLFLSVVTVGELQKGIVLAPPAKRSKLEQSIEAFIPVWFAGRILPVTRAVAKCWGELDGKCQRAGRRLGVADAMIAATALERGLTMVTRNVKDFADLGVKILNPGGPADATKRK